jgi:uncharacterized protein (DUF433 family)
MTMNYQPYIIRDPAICGGELVVKGTRVKVRTVIAFAAVSTEEDLPVPVVSSIV